MATVSATSVFKKGPVKIIGSDNDAFQGAQQTEDPGFLESLWRGVKTYGKNVGQDFMTRGQNIIDSVSDAGEKKQSVLSGGLQVTGEVAGMVGDFFGEAIKPVVEKGADVLSNNPTFQKFATSQTGDNIVNSVDNAALKYAEWAQNNPEASKNLEASVNIAALLTGEKPTQGVLKATTETTKAASGKMLTNVSKTLASTGRATEATGKSLYGSAFTPTVKEAERQLAYKAQAPFLTRAKAALSGTPVKDASGKIIEAPINRATTAFEYGLKGTEKGIGIRSRRINQQLWKTKIQPALDNTDAAISKDELFKPIIARINDTIEPGRKQALRDAFSAIKEEYKGVTKFSLKDAQKVKSSLDEFTPDKVFRGKQIASEYKTLQSDMAHAIRQKTYESLKGQNIKKAYLDYANLKELEKIGVNAITEKGKFGGFGSFWTAAYDAATTPVKTVGGKILYRVGNKLEFLGEKGIKKFGEFLESKGFDRPQPQSSLERVVGAVRNAKDSQGGYIRLPRVGVNKYQQYEPGAFPKALRQGEVLSKAPLEKVGFQKSVVLDGVKKGSLADVAAKSQLKGRPAHQIAIENAINSNNFAEALKIAKSLPAADPYRGSMLSTIKTMMKLRK